jgi:hypothetical protein
MPARSRAMILAGGVVLVVLIVALAANLVQKTAGGSTLDTPGPTTSTGCQLKPFRQEQAASLMQGGAILAYERNGGASCIDELYAIYPDGLIAADDGEIKIEKQVTPAEVEQLLADISAKGWFTEEMYDTWHTPCGQCYGYYLTVAYNGQVKTVKAVDGGTDAPADYWQVISRINGVIPHFTPAP